MKHIFWSQLLILQVKFLINEMMARLFLLLNLHTLSFQLYSASTFYLFVLLPMYK